MTQAIAAAAMFALMITACAMTEDTDISVSLAPETDITPGHELDTDSITEIPPVPGIIPEGAPDIDGLLEAPPVINAIPGTNACGASRYQSLIGKNFAASAFSHAGKYRVIRPGDSYTGDFIQSRLNIFVDEGGIIIELNCG